MGCMNSREQGVQDQHPRRGPQTAPGAGRHAERAMSDDTAVSAGFGLGIGRADDAGMAGQPSRRLTEECRQAFHLGRQLDWNELLQLRGDFWGSRVEGNRMMWQAIRTAAEHVLEGDLDTANAILEASQITTPQATLELCYDERGTAYKVPKYCFANPIEAMGGSASGGGGAGSSAAGAAAPGGGEDVTLRIRIAPGEDDQTLECSSGDSIQHVKTLLAAKMLQDNDRELEPERQRVIYMGKELANTVSIAQAGIETDKVIHVYVRPARS